MNHIPLKRTDYSCSYNLINGERARFEMSYRGAVSELSDNEKKSDTYLIHYQSCDGVNSGFFNLFIGNQIDKLRTVCNIPGYIYHIESPTGEKVTISNRSGINSY